MSGKNQNRGPAMGNLLNLERVPALAPKFSNQIGKTCAGFCIKFMPQGMNVEVLSTINTDGVDISGKPELVSIPEWESRRAKRNAPSDSDRISALKRKYELRLGKEFPAKGPQSGSEESIQAWLGTLGFAERTALLLSQKDFAKKYPDGFR